MKEFLKNKRLNATLTQQQASTLLGYQSSQFLSNLERGLSKPPLPVLFKMCDVYGISEEEMRAQYLTWVKDEALKKATNMWQTYKTQKST
jgi:transcriptional regulator with XRE-family HTH domain